MKIVFAGIAALLALAVAVTLIFAAGFSRGVARLDARLAEASPGAPRQDLPPEVAAFARRGLAGSDPARALALKQSAEMRLKPGAGWTALAARQTIATARPGFAWLAEMRLGPLPVVRVLDSYADGAGLLDVRFFGAFRLDAYEGPEAALSEGLRYLAELPWSPDAILTNRAITWEMRAEGVAARMGTEGGPAEVVFTLDAAGDIVGVQARGRPATLPDGRVVPLDWRGAFSDYAEIDGRRIPTRGEVGYVYPDGYESYFLGRVTALSAIE
ncbi:DUF6544 family protein [Sinisalibacter aestuarii]|uniref:DUF4893 domain-containing protein n=1 Tax=Sinisalibacter aestuarii TaxID=2949426 RepID=A0ABQ5LRT5_9RHOB|nr:DUF6544 family protein [Sinisalibacter aestuarii]GKY87448.1 hypothetical protein STA1M1_13170 [Sinisalibacter aestuarii]